MHPNLKLPAQMSHIINPEAPSFYREIPVKGFPLGTTLRVAGHESKQDIRNIFASYTRYGSGDEFMINPISLLGRVVMLDFYGNTQFMYYLMAIAGQDTAEFHEDMSERPPGDGPH